MFETHSLVQSTLTSELSVLHEDMSSIGAESLIIAQSKTTKHVYNEEKDTDLNWFSLPRSSVYNLFPTYNDSRRLLPTKNVTWVRLRCCSASTNGVVNLSLY